MNKKLTLIIPILLLLTTPTLAKTQYIIQVDNASTRQYCADNNTLIIEKYYNDTGEIISQVEKPAKYGCVNGTITSPNTINQYGGIATAGLLSITALILIVAWLLGKRHGFLRLPFTFLAAYFLYLAANMIYGIGQRFKGITQITGTSQALNIAAQAFWWILLFAILYFVIYIIRMALSYFSGGNKSYGDKYGGG